jgi:hypothetical protein
MALAKAPRKRLAKRQADRRLIRRLGEIQDQYWHDQAMMAVAMRYACEGKPIPPKRPGFWQSLKDFWSGAHLAPPTI